MIREFALEPDLVVDWLCKSGPHAAALRDGFGVGTPRILSRYPGDWKQRLREKWDSTIRDLEEQAEGDEAKGRVQTLKARGDAVLQQLTLRTIGRGGFSWNEPAGWLPSALRHHPEPLQAILALARAEGDERVLTEESVFDSPTWNRPRSLCVQRDPGALAGAVEALLRRSTRLIFVDPWFRPESGHMRSFGAFLRVASNRWGASPPTICVYTHVNANKRGVAWEVFEEEIERKIAADLPVGWKVRIMWIKEREGGEEIHNRYILSELGGVVFGRGLDAETSSKTEDVLLMDREHHERRWLQYAGSPLAFDMDRGGRELLVTRTSSPPVPQRPSGRR